MTPPIGITLVGLFDLNQYYHSQVPKMLQWRSSGRHSGSAASLIGTLLGQVALSQIVMCPSMYTLFGADIVKYVYI